MVRLPYIKMHGCRNDYIFIDNRDGKVPLLLAAFIQNISNRKIGIGSDGLILIEKPESKEALARMRIFNADGSEGKMCGNGIRCVAKLLYEWLGPKEVYPIETLSGMRFCYVLNTSDSQRFIVKVNMGRPSFLPHKIPVLFEDVMVMDEEFEIEDHVFKISCVSMGNPHCVVEVKDLEKFDVGHFGPLFEKHEVFSEGVNVEFIELKESKVFQRTWERGSGETKACGTGACAVAATLILKKQKTSPVEIGLKGGTLMIEWDGLHEVWMTGEAVTEGEGELETLP